MRHRGSMMLLAVQAGLVLLLFRMLLWMLPFARICGVADRLSKWASASGAHHSAATIARIIVRASQLVPHGSCLVRAFAAKVLLAASGMPATIHIGVLGRGATFEAHAWLVCNGVVILGGEEAGQFRPLLIVSSTGEVGEA